jgi:hypothetical protein
MLRWNKNGTHSAYKHIGKGGLDYYRVQRISDGKNSATPRALTDTSVMNMIITSPGLSV